jgi:hypothetical protein
MSQYAWFLIRYFLISKRSKKWGCYSTKNYKVECDFTNKRRGFLHIIIVPIPSNAGQKPNSN